MTQKNYLGTKIAAGLGSLALGAVLPGCGHEVQCYDNSYCMTAPSEEHCDSRNVVMDVFSDGFCRHPGTIFSRCDGIRWLRHDVVDECRNGCDYNTSSCIADCFSDEDCPRETWFEGPEYCSGNSMVLDEHGYLCQDEVCVDNFLRQVPQRTSIQCGH